MPAELPDDEALIIEALIVYHYELRESNTERARQAWKLARDHAAEHGLTIDDVPPCDHLS